MKITRFLEMIRELNTAQMMLWKIPSTYQGVLQQEKGKTAEMTEKKARAILPDDLQGISHRLSNIR